MYIFQSFLLYAWKVPAFSGNFLERVLRLLQIIHHFVKSFQEPPFPRPTLFRHFLLSGNAGMKFRHTKIGVLVVMLSLKNFTARIWSITRRYCKFHKLVRLIENIARQMTIFWRAYGIGNAVPNKFIQGNTFLPSKNYVLMSWNHFVNLDISFSKSWNVFCQFPETLIGQYVQLTAWICWFCNYKLKIRELQKYPKSQ